MEEQQRRDIVNSLEQAMDALIAVAALKPRQLFVLGASTSEVAGHDIGSSSSQEIGDLIIDTVLRKLEPTGAWLAVGCCEHLNRAIVLPRAAAEHYGLEPVWVRPALKAGGACGTAYYDRLAEPVMVERVAAHAGMDIGDAMIGMHLKAVAVPVRCPVRRVGQANLVLARTRPKYVGGPRAQYE